MVVELFIGQFPLNGYHPLQELFFKMNISFGSLSKGFLQLGQYLSSKAFLSVRYCKHINLSFNLNNNYSYSLKVHKLFLLFFYMKILSIKFS